MNYFIGTFEVNINPGYPQGFTIYLQEKNKKDKEAEKLDISVSNTKDIIYNILSLA